jgi:hypothetical protein
VVHLWWSESTRRKAFAIASPSNRELLTMSTLFS